jgi:large subunit ribosomal protein L12
MKEMEYVYAAMLLHSSGKDITEEGVVNILSAAGLKPDQVRVKALVAALAEVDIEEALKAPVFAASTPVVATSTVVEEEVEEEEPQEEAEEEEEDLQGLGALFG